MERFLVLVTLSLGLSALSLTTSAQQAAPQDGQQQGAEQQQSGPRRHKRMFGMARNHGGIRALNRLNLTETQQGQIRSIREATHQRTEAQHQELRQLFQTRRDGGQLSSEQQARAEQLISDLRATHQSVNQEILSVLTAEQRTQLEQLRQEPKSRRRGLRGDRWLMKPEAQ